MPLYEYECDACGERFEVIQKSFSSPAPEACEKCGKGPVHRLQSSPAIQFKGSGFYITDYAKKSPEGDGSKGKSEGSKTESTSDSKTSDAKTDSAAPKDSSAKSDAPAASTSSESTSTSTKKD